MLVVPEARMIVLIHCESDTVRRFRWGLVPAVTSQALTAACFSCQANLLPNTGLMLDRTPSAVVLLTGTAGLWLTVAGLLICFFLCVWFLPPHRLCVFFSFSFSFLWNYSLSL